MDPVNGLLQQIRLNLFRHGQGKAEDVGMILPDKSQI